MTSTHSPALTRRPRASGSVAQQHSDQSFPYVLVVGTTGAISALASVWLTALALS